MNNTIKSVEFLKLLSNFRNIEKQIVIFIDEISLFYYLENNIVSKSEFDVLYEKIIRNTVDFKITAKYSLTKSKIKELYKSGIIKIHNNFSDSKVEIFKRHQDYSISKLKEAKTTIINRLYKYKSYTEDMIKDELSFIDKQIDTLSSSSFSNDENIRSLNFNTRIHNILKDNNIVNTNQLKLFIEHNRLENLKGLGAGSYKEVLHVMNCINNDTL